MSLSSNGPPVHHLLFADDSLLMCRASQEEAAEITRCLKLYEDASGQMINKAKSSIIFGSRVPESIKTEVKTALNIDKEGGEGTYLGLPECFSGSKVKMLDYIREKLQGRLKGWFSKALSHGGKEILLKSIALALPVYAMSCFKLPKTVITKLNSAMIEFWWSTGDNKKRIPWVAWQKLCKPKSEGGLGFHDIEMFNQALLGKQAWRIWQKPSSLLAQILKHRYFDNCSFLESTAGTRPSFAWRSILHGKDLLKQGLIQSVGNGANTRVWIDNWVFDKVPRTPNYRPEATVDLTLTVDQLLDPITRGWNASRVRQLVADEDVELVLNTKVNSSSSDLKVWSFTKNGIYSSRSGYQCLEVLQILQSSATPTIPPLEKSLWSNIWKTKTTPKLKHFLWRALSGALAVKDRLRSRYIPVDPKCLLCGLEQESICHLLFNCNYAQEVWQRSHIPLPPAGFSSSSVFLNLHYLVSLTLKSKEAADNCKAFPWILWHIWKSRNCLCFEQQRLQPSEVAKKALEEFVIWSELHSSNGNPSGSHPQPMAPMKQWTKPPPGWIKCNIGSSWVNGQTNCGASWLARNNLGVPLHHSRRSYSSLSSHLENDLMSLYWAAECLSNMRVPKVIFQSSSAAARMAMLHPSYFPALCPLILKIHEKLQCLDEWSLEYVDEHGNQPATAIALSVTRDHRYPSYISQSSPSWLRQMLISELSL